MAGLGVMNMPLRKRVKLYVFSEDRYWNASNNFTIFTNVHLVPSRHKKHRDFSRYQVPVIYAIPPVLMQTGVLLCWLTHQGQEMHRVSELGHHWFKQLLVPIRRQIIAWTSDNLLSTVPVGKTSTKFQSNYKNNCTRKLISKWRLRNGCHLSTLKCV